MNRIKKLYKILYLTILFVMCFTVLGMASNYKTDIDAATKQPLTAFNGALYLGQSSEDVLTAFSDNSWEKKKIQDGSHFYYSFTRNLDSTIKEQVIVDGTASSGIRTFSIRFITKNVDSAKNIGSMIENNLSKILWKVQPTQRRFGDELGKNASLTFKWIQADGITITYDISIMMDRNKNFERADLSIIRSSAG